MISLGPAKDALSMLKPPAPDAAFLKTSLNIAQSGSMFQNPMASTFSSLDTLGLSSVASSFSGIPGCESLIAQCTAITSNASAVRNVSNQMFTSVMPISSVVPTELLSMSPSLTSDDKSKLSSFSLPSITDIMSTAQNEQDDNERMGTAGNNPCLPVQKTMENTMKSARKLASGIESVKGDVLAGLNKIKSAYSTLQNAVGSAVTAARAALNQAISAVSSVVGKISGWVQEAGKSLVDSIKTVRDSVEKSMSLASASLARDLIKNNPCMKSVLSSGSAADKPGSIGTYEYVATFRFKNKSNADMANWLANPNNIKVVSYMSPYGYETMESDMKVVSQTATETVIDGTVTYTIDVDKALANHVDLEPALKPDNDGNLVDAGKLKSATAFIKFNNSSGEEVSRIYAALNLANAHTAPSLKVIQEENGTKNDSLILVTPIEWMGGKKISLLTPEMQQISQPMADPDPDLKVTEAVGVIISEKEVAEKEEKAQQEMIPQAVTQETTEIRLPTPTKARPAQRPFKKSVIMKRITTPQNNKWKDAHSVLVDNLSGKGSFMVMLDMYASKGNSPPEIEYQYEMDSRYIDELIAEIMATSKTGVGGSIYHQATKMTYYKKDKTLFGYAWMYFHMNYNAASNQVSFETTYTVGDEENDFTWDSVVFKNDNGLPDEVVSEAPTIINPPPGTGAGSNPGGSTPTYTKSLSGPTTLGSNVPGIWNLTGNPFEVVSVSVSWSSNSTTIPVTLNSQGVGSFTHTIFLIANWKVLATFSDNSTKTMTTTVISSEPEPDPNAVFSVSAPASWVLGPALYVYAWSGGSRSTISVQGGHVTFQDTKTAIKYQTSTGSQEAPINSQGNGECQLLFPGVAVGELLSIEARYHNKQGDYVMSSYINVRITA
jgi:hypothetical protein